jgi:nucleoside 2-deoxyribosyltransferase
MKECLKCGVTLTIQNFTHKQNWNICDDCERKYGREWHTKYYKNPKNRKRSNLLDRKNYMKNREKELKKDKKYYLENRDTILERERIHNLEQSDLKYRKKLAIHLGLKNRDMQGLDVHHIDLDTHNNDIHNLLMVQRKTHRIIHSKINKMSRPIQVVYLAGPLEQVSTKYAFDWRNKAYDYLASKAIVSLVPGKEQIELSPRQIVDLDMTMIKNSDALLVNLDFLTQTKRQLGTGTITELGMAYAESKIVIGFTNKKKLAQYKFIRGVVSHLFTSLEEALEVLVSINNLVISTTDCYGRRIV